MTAQSRDDERLWSIGELSDAEGLSTLIRYRASPEPRVRAGLPMQFVVTWRFRNPLETGLPDSPEHEQATSAERVFVPALEADARALLVLVSTGAGLREWYFYCREPLELEDSFNESVSGRESLPVELHSGEDPEWRVYEEYVAPFVARH